MPRRDEPLDLDDDDDRPRRKASGGVPVWVWVLLGVGGLFVVGTVVVCGGMLWVGKKTAENIEKQVEDTQREREWDRNHVAGKKSDMTIAEYRVQKPAKPVVVRADVELGNYWNYAYGGTAETHYSLSLLGSGLERESAWVPKDSKDGRRIYELCKDAKRHRMTLRISREGPTGRPTPADADGTAVLEVISFN